jgi:hypothetical protein
MGVELGKIGMFHGYVDVYGCALSEDSDYAGGGK